MTYEDASRDIISYIANGCCNGDNALSWDTLNTAVSALSKQTPKSPNDMSLIDVMCESHIVGLCGNCRRVVNNTENYCRKCGQALDWSEAEVRKDED